MAKRCKCAGDFETTVKVDTTAQLLKAFLGLARHYQMPLLHEQVTWMFKMNPKLAKRMDIDITDAPESNEAVEKAVIESSQIMIKTAENALGGTFIDL